MTHSGACHGRSIDRKQPANWNEVVYMVKNEMSLIYSIRNNEKSLLLDIKNNENSLLLLSRIVIVMNFH